MDQNADVIVIDDFVPLEEQIRIENACKNERICWSYIESSFAGNSPDLLKRVKDNMDANMYPEKAIDTSQFVHTLWNKDATSGPLGEPKSIHFNQFTGLLGAMPFKWYSIMRMKINFKPPALNVPEGFYNLPHVDFEKLPYESLTAVYYVNNSDGDTIIFNQTIDEWGDGDGKSRNLIIKQQVSPKRGRIVIFSGKNVHSAGIPKNNNNRLVVNINLRISA